jgi:hypothetical protein
MQNVVFLLLCCLSGPPEIFSATGVYAEKPKATQDPYLIMFTADWCGPCRAWKNSGKKKQIEEAGVSVTLVDIDRNPEYRIAGGPLPAVERFPTFWLMVPPNQKPVKVWVGTVSHTDVRANLRIRRSKDDLDKWVRSNYTEQTTLTMGMKNNSEVWNHLTDGTDGTHVFTKDQISGLDLWVALALHDALHSRKVTPFVD